MILEAESTEEPLLSQFPSRPPLLLVASRVACWEKVASSPSLPLFLALGHVTHSGSLSEKQPLCCGCCSAYGYVHATLHSDSQEMTAYCGIYVSLICQ